MHNYLGRAFPRTEPFPLAQYPYFSSILGTAVTLKTLEFWVDHGVPLPGYGNLLIESKAHTSAENVLKGLPYPPIPPIAFFDLSDTNDYSAGQPYSVTEDTNQESSWTHLQDPTYVVDQNTPPMIQPFNAPSTIAMPPATAAHIYGLICAVVSVVGLVALTATFLSRH